MRLTSTSCQARKKRRAQVSCLQTFNVCNMLLESNYSANIHELKYEWMFALLSWISNLATVIAYDVCRCGLSIDDFIVRVDLAISK